MTLFQQTPSSCGNSQKGLYLRDYQRLLDTSARPNISIAIKFIPSFMTAVDTLANSQSE
jgi:hypothetical protein